MFEAPYACHSNPNVKRRAQTLDDDSISTHFRHTYQLLAERAVGHTRAKSYYRYLFAPFYHLIILY